ncbi:MAG: ATP-binding cassette domain-containing protein, partial [Hoeflea sp.]|nr:ATP-binding cassette domain-containing protein [Hoeflea sp.]
MARLVLDNITKSFGTVQVINGIDLDIAHREFVVFVGPSGCGKSTMLRMIAGLESVSGGRIVIGDRDVTHVAPSKREIAMVFQSYALFPHLTVAENIGFGLRLANTPKVEIDRQVGEVARTLQIEQLLARKPRHLSGGQRQRVAIGRSIIRNPKVFLFDEPLSNLDASLRVQMRLEIARLHQRLDATMVYVTHDQTEAMTLADRIVDFNAGRIEQGGTPLEL